MSTPTPWRELLARAPELFPDEVVTNALVRYVDLPEGAGRLGLITLDNGFDHTKPTVLGPRGLANLAAALDDVAEQAAEGAIVGVGVTGKPFIFNVGADLKGVPAVTAETAPALGEAGHAVLGRLGSLGVPSFAFVNGAVMGGGLEVALNCTYRTLSSATPMIAFPECFLGLLPAWGGCTLLPRLIGAEAAVTVIVENALNQNRQLTTAQAVEFGLTDVLLEPADFLAQSLAWAARVLRGAVTVPRRPLDDAATWEAAVALGRAIADQKVHGASPAPYRALEVIAMARTAPIEDCFAAENAALADLVMGDELRASLYAFDLVQRRARHPAGAPDASLARPVTKVGIVGAGLMASQLALLFARRLEVPVVLTDISQERIDAGVGYVHGELDKLRQRGRLSPDRHNRLNALVTGSLTKDAFADADFVIEAVFEDLAVKRQVFAELEAVVQPECVLATNTSSLSVSEMGAKLEHPERVVGFHFFNPVAVLPLLEVVRGRSTDDAALSTALAVAKKLRKTAVLVQDAPAFVVNRLLTRFLGVVIGAVDGGTPIEAADSALDPLGLPIAPLALLELVGPAVALHVAETLAGAFPDRFGVSQNLARMVKAGKTSVYRHENGVQVVDPEVAALFKVAADGAGPPTADEVRERALTALAQEVRLLLDEGVVAEPQDVDLCMIAGAGWPFHLGGITPYLDRTGVSEQATGRRFLPPGVASVPTG